MYTIVQTTNMRIPRQKTLNNAQLRKFEREIWNYYEGNKRDLPWRRTTNPYYILISEVMLQQTQVSRVILKYEEFIKKFGTIESLAKASKAEVLTIWQGLGYNRRALFLKRACETLFDESLKSSKSTSKLKSPKFPTTREELLKLPGIGQSTAGAILAFAFNTPVPFIETNIRAVFLYFSLKNLHLFLIYIYTSFYKKRSIIKSKKENPREWYYALYDYGTMLKAKLGREKTALHKQSKHYNKQSKFKGSNREIRGAILRLFTKHPKITEEKICELLNTELPHRTDRHLKAGYIQPCITRKRRLYPKDGCKDK